MAAKTGAKDKQGSGVARIATNRRARFLYDIVEEFEAGIALLGPEVKSLRAGLATLTDGFAFVKGGELFLRGVHIPHYANAGRENVEPDRERKLLLHRREISRLAGKVAERGLTLVPLSLYWKNGRAKVELALVRGRKNFDKRQAVKKREHDREMDRARRQRR
jgi:SsrA-binding protein